MANVITPQQIQPTRAEKLEWSRMAQAAYRRGRNDIGHTYSAYASIKDASTIPLSVFDDLQRVYRLWLNDGFSVVDADMLRGKAVR